MTPQEESSTPGEPGTASGQAVHHGATECRVCPVCQGLALLHERSPELYVHVADALGALTAAVRSLVEPRLRDGAPGDGPEPDQPVDADGEPSPRSPMQRIDVS